FDWCGYTIHTPPPPAGGFTAIQGLATLKALAWEKSDFADPLAVQARVEALRIAWDDRLRLLGDPAHTDMPRQNVLSEDYAKRSAQRVREAVKAGKPVEA